MLFNVSVPESTRVTAVRVYVGTFNHVTPAPFHAILVDSKGKTIEKYVRFRERFGYVVYL